MQGKRLLYERRLTVASLFIATSIHYTLYVPIDAIWAMMNVRNVLGCFLADGPLPTVKGDQVFS